MFLGSAIGVLRGIFADMERRTLIKRLGGLLLAPSLPLELPASFGKWPVLRVAHLTDVHLKDKWDAPARFRRCLHHVQTQRPGVDMILNGGDIVFDMNKENLDTIKAQWELWHSTVKAESSLPIHYCLGNHDIWWNLEIHIARQRAPGCRQQLVYREIGG
jgi:predicted MPP superfamily phosphohydrolase